MLEILAGWTVTQIVGYGSASIGALLLGWLFKWIDNETISKKVELFFYGLGVIVTVGLGKWKYTKGLWKKTIEPFCIDLIENVIGAAVSGFIRGLRSDDKES